MKYVIQAFGIFLIIAGISLLVKPDLLIGWLSDHAGESWLYATAIIVRLGLGMLFILSARLSKFPLVFKILGYITVIAALAFLVMGQTRFVDLISTLLSTFSHLSPLSGIMSLILGALLIYSYRT